MSGALDVTVIAHNKHALSRVAYRTKESLSYDRMALLGRAHSSLKAKAAALPISASIAVIRGFSLKYKLMEKREVTFVNSREQLLKMLFSGRVDYIVAEEAITTSFSRQRNFPPLASVLLLDNQSFSAVFSKLRLGEDAESLGRRFDASLKQLIQQGYWRIILERYSRALHI